MEGATEVVTQIKAEDLQVLIDAITAQINVSTVISILAVVFALAVGFVFMWWAVRKVTSMFMSAFKKGKLSI